MKKLETLQLEGVTGGIRWGSFAAGFCDGFTVGSVILGQFASAAAVEAGCNAFGIGTNVLEHLP